MRIEYLAPAYGAGAKVATFDLVLTDGSRHRDWRLKRSPSGRFAVFAPNRQGVPLELRSAKKSAEVTAMVVSQFYPNAVAGRTDDPGSVAIDLG